MSKINVDSSNVEDLKINSSYDKKEEKIEEEEEEENEYNLIADEPNQTNEEAKENSIINNNITTIEDHYKNISIKKGNSLKGIYKYFGLFWSKPNYC